MPLFNRRNKAGSGAGEQVHVGHQDPFGVPDRNIEYNQMSLDLKAQHPDKVFLKDPFAPKQSPVTQQLSNLRADRARQGKKPLGSSAAYMKDYIKSGSKIKPPTTPDPFA